MKKTIIIAALSAFTLVSLNSCTFVKVNRGMFEKGSSERILPSKETKTVTAPNNYALETEQLSRCILFGEKPRL